MGKADTPPAPDYAGAAQQTAQGNLENARLTTKANRVNTFTPYGNLTYQSGANGDPDQWNANVSLSPQQQSLLDQQSKTSMGLGGLQDAATGRVGQSLNGPMPDAYDPTQATNSAQANIMSRLEPQFNRDQDRMENQLINQGLQRGSQAWNDAEKTFGQTRNDAYQQAALQGINLGQSQQAQQYQQAMASRTAPINELSAIRTGSQVTNPNFSPQPQQTYTGGANYSGAMGNTYQAGLNSTNAQNAASSNFTNGLFSLGSAALMFSDRRLKSNIVKVGDHPGGFGIYEYDIFGRRERGVIAQEVRESRPDAVHEGPRGFLMVDYGSL
jgi:hypothetical protein